MDGQPLPDFQLGGVPADAEDAKALYTLMNAGVTVAALRGISPQRMEAYYALGFACYQSGRYSDAEKIFAFMLVHDHLDARTHKALGITLQMQRKHEQAIKSYGVASMLDLTDPEPPVRIAQCLLTLGRPDEARGALDFARGTFKRRPDDRLSKRVELMSEQLAQASQKSAAAH